MSNPANVSSGAQATKANGAVAQPVAGQPSYAELLARIAELEKKASAPKGVMFSIADKGGVSASGFGRFPTTLYAEQWLKLLDAANGQDLRRMIAGWLADGSILLKASKDETVEACKARSAAFGKAMIAPVSTTPAA
jgi:hypothetical protein